MQFQDLNIEPIFFIISINGNETNYQKKTDNQNYKSSSIGDFVKALQECYKQKNTLSKELYEVKKTVNAKRNVLFFLKLIIIGFILSSLKKEIDKLNEYIINIESNLQKCKVLVDYNFDTENKKKYNNLIQHFNSLSKSKKIWDITSQTWNDGTKDRSHATSLIDRRESFFNIDSLDLIETNASMMFFKNKNGNDFYIGPSFLISFGGANDIKIVDIDDVSVEFGSTNFIETSAVPSDAKILSYTWKYMNKNGGPDKRYNDNYKIPLVNYAELEFKSNKIKLLEKYQISNIELTKKFVAIFKEYQSPKSTKGDMKMGLKDLL
jgi:hypothetical protein